MKKRGFRSSAAGFCVRRWFKKNEMKGKLCNFVLVEEHVCFTFNLSLDVRLLRRCRLEVAVVIGDPVRM